MKECEDPTDGSTGSGSLAASASSFCSLACLRLKQRHTLGQWKPERGRPRPLVYTYLLSFSFSAFSLLASWAFSAIQRETSSWLSSVVFLSFSSSAEKVICRASYSSFSVWFALSRSCRGHRSRENTSTVATGLQDLSSCPTLQSCKSRARWEPDGSRRGLWVIGTFTPHRCPSSQI